MYKISLLLLIFSINIFAQMLSMEDRYKQLYKNFKKSEYQEKTSKLIRVIIENREILKKSKEILSDSYENKTLKSRAIILIMKTIYDNENSIIIKKTLNELISEDKEFKTQIIKIIKAEQDTNKIFTLLKKFSIKKLDKRFDEIFQRYLNDKFLCQRNIDLAFSVISKKLLAKEVEEMIIVHYKNNKLPNEYIELLKQKMVSLPYNYSINNWFKRYYKKVLIDLKEYFNKNPGNFLINNVMKSLELDIIYSLLQNELLLKEFKKEFYNDFIKDRKSLKKFLKSSLINDSDTLFKEIEEKRFNCFHLNEKMFNIDMSILSFYFKNVLELKEIESKILPILFKSLK